MAAEKPLSHIRVLEMAGLAPAPFAGLILADLGADVVRIDRKSEDKTTPTGDLMTRGKRSVGLDLKSATDRQTFLDLVREADVLIEGYRPGVMEALKLGPSDIASVNASIVYARLTGFERNDPVWGKAAGHDINYIALSGLLSLIGGPDRPVPPGPMLGDMAGGGMSCVVGILAALIRRGLHRPSAAAGASTSSAGTSARAQAQTGPIVVETNMQDGAAYLATFLRHARDLGPRSFSPRQRGFNVLDGGAPFYRCYATAPAKPMPRSLPGTEAERAFRLHRKHAQAEQFVAVGCLEPAFYTDMLKRLGLIEAELPDRGDVEQWPALEAIFATKFREKTRDEWTAIFAGTDSCVTPVVEQVLDRRAPAVVDGLHRVTYANRDEPAGEVAGRQKEKVGMPAGFGQEDVLRDWLGGGAAGKAKL